MSVIQAVMESEAESAPVAATKRGVLGRFLQRTTSPVIVNIMN